MAEDVPVSDDGAGLRARELEIGKLLSIALELPAAQQEAYLAAACDDSTLIEEVLRLLDFDAERGGTFLQAPAARILELGSNDETQPSGPRPVLASPSPSQLGGYTLLDCLGEGGMGKVYRAIQHEPIERQVAVKVMARETPGAEALRRFDLERKALGRLAHPNVAQLYEAGATDQGRPYVVMELIEGLEITRYCDLHGLSITDRLRLFVDVCRGIQHAHQKQILHRDLKPSNILVTMVDGAPVAKIIDFGIARDLDRPADFSFATGARLLGTPQYMSPEAIHPAEYGGLDTRTDVYSLGVVLYELVVGVRPFKSSARDLPQLMNEILQAEPARPSARLEEIDGAARYRLASSRGTDPEAHLSALQGDLDWIVTKAMDRDRDRRYGSANELADEIERVLDHLPIEARPPALSYRASKWIRRNRVGATLGALTLFGLLVATILTGISLRRAHLAEAQSRLDAEISEQSLDFVLNLFDSVSPEGALRQDASVRDLLREGVRDLHDNDLPPLAKAKILETLGEVHLRLGLFPPARELLQESLTIREEEVSLTAAETLHAARLLGNLERRAGRFEAAEPLLSRVLAGAETQSDEQPLKLADALGSFGNLRWSQGRLEEALKLHQRSLDLRQTHLGSDDEAVAISHNNLGTLYYTASDLESAEPHLRRAHGIFEARLGPRHPRVATALGNLALVLQQRGAMIEAVRLQRRILEVQREIFGSEHPSTATALHNLAGSLVNLGELEEAEGLYERALTGRRRALGENHPETLKTLAALGRWAWRSGDYERASRLLHEALERRQLGTEGESAAIYRLRRYLAVVQRDTGDARSACSALARVLAWQEIANNDNSRGISRTLLDLGLCEQKLGLTAESERTLRRSLAIQRELQREDLQLADTLFALGEQVEAQGPSEEAESLFAEALRLRRAFLPEQHPDRLRSENRALRNLGRSSETQA